MKTSRMRSLAAIAAISVLGLTGCGLKPSTSEVPAAEAGSIQPVPGAEGQSLTIGSKNFTEQLILGKIAVLTAQAAGFDVVDMTNIPGSQPAREVLVNGEVDMEWEYTGTAWLSYMGKGTTIADSAEMYKAVHDADLENGLTWGEPSPLNNTYAMAVRSDYAQEKGISKLSDMAKVPVEERTMCLETEFNSRPDGFNGMLEAYGLERGAADGVPESNISIMDTGTVYTATDQGTCNFGEVFTTDGRINSLDLTVLEDDRQYFPAYNASAVMGTDVVEQYPELADEFNKVGQALNNDVMRELNLKVDVEGQEPANVAYDWMKQEGFIQ
ncbi:glycine betaine ABC transporter substrate-binding protein [Rothia aerolata]|uniref:Glycine/betaine ABC transporter substrate-binding protein n=1 Tax=Rothia aerolata TaxID=1812262 RepID=A0A917IVT2_9MICC|nr:glycine betaine ABC transporter substrate-binding protein [Rothia aerolata]GGH64148.1 glycine/betaine ABC transporter substrate-binding protein [Rothia aerolata]